MPNDFFSKLMKFFLVLIVSCFIAITLFFIWSCIQYAMNPVCIWFQDGDYACSFWDFLYDFGTFIAWIIIVPIAFLMSLPSSRNIVNLFYSRMFTLEKKSNTKKSVKIILWSFLPVPFSLASLLLLIAVIGYFKLTFWALILFPVIYMSLYVWVSKKIKILSQKK